MKIKRFDQMNENGPNDSPQDIMKNMKTIQNWHEGESPKKERDIIVAGRYIECKKCKGYINRIEGSNVFIDSLDNPGEIVKISINDAIKGYKPEKERSTKVDISLTGPNNASVAKSLKEHVKKFDEF